MTFKEWNKRDDFKAAWRAFYKSEAGEALNRVLISLGTPVATMPPVGIDFTSWNASLNARREGFFEAVKLLSILSEDKPQTEELPAPWETNK